jgi:hypothetical protein
MDRFAAILLMFACLLSPACTQLPKEDRFWKWFQANEARLFDVESDQEKVFYDLNIALHRVHPDLTFEFGPKEEGQREFVISADGSFPAFPAVTSLADKAPPLPRWKIMKFRQRRSPQDLTYEGLAVASGQVTFTLEADGEKAGITLFIEGYDRRRDKRFLGIGFLFLDSFLGEHDVVTRVGFVEFKPASAASKIDKRPLSELAESFDKFMAAK